MIDSILTYDATGGGTQLVVPPCSLTVKGPSSQVAYLVGYAMDGISVNDAIVTCTTNKDWDPAGIHLKPTTAGIATSGGPPISWLPVKVPVKGGDVFTIVSTSGANPTHVILYVDYPPYGFQGARDMSKPPVANLTYKATVAGGTNCAAGTFVMGATPLRTFIGGRRFNVIGATISGAFTTTAFLGLRKSGSSYMMIIPCPLTDVAQAWQPFWLPPGVMESIQQGDEIEVWWSSVSAEQPTGNVWLAY